ncbi:sarcosine oxidase subunit beta [Thermoactinomyces sp. DSM 45891]|uniref:NAD(P)/FAD-dependent oxidoreductase n=1 Tax=Thermoactinomyces sp. DSM 45891 TaxID=1761907 RepID=UPI00091F99B8|nr:FAD-dependent oxidoreductase [Thermoactinomyces sp. DSM 45891]SFX03563.1 sarcosine oxidase subunit beta [Thermoactinomyces sp. DSM 45891]
MKTENADVVIIGGGIIGMATAYYLAKLGSDVVVLEKGEIAGGTSSKCDGNILAIDKEPGFDSQMSLESQKLVSQLVFELDEEFEYRAPGSILVCESEEEMEAAEMWVNRQKEAGLPFRMLDRGEIRSEWKHMADDIHGGLECATDSTVNPVLFTYSLAVTAQRLGARLKTHTWVTGIRLDSYGAVAGVETSNGLIRTKHVVNAAGVWSKPIAQMVGIEIPVEPRKGHILVSSRTESIGTRKVMEFSYLMSKFGKERKVDKRTEQYGVALVFEPTASQNFLIGSSREFVGFDMKINVDVIRCIARRAIRFFPAMKDIPVLRSYCGLRPWTPDHLPIVSPVEEVPGFYIAAGHEGDGISLAAITGKVMSECITGQETTISIEPLHYNRFKKEAGKR